MNFASRELCEILHKLGCVSESEHRWSLYSTYKRCYVVRKIRAKEDLQDRAGGRYTPAFICQDFVGPSDKARENARICATIMFEKLPLITTIDTEGCIQKVVLPTWHLHSPVDILRHVLADSKSEQEFWAYIEEAIKEE